MFISISIRVSLLRAQIISVIARDTKVIGSTKEAAVNRSRLYGNPLSPLS